MTFELSLKIKLNSLINKQIQEVFFMESNSSNFIYTVTPQFWFGRLLSHSFNSRFEKSILLYQVPLVFHCCLMDGLWYFWLHPLINSTHIFYNWMEPLPIFSFFYLSNPWLSVPPSQKTRKSLILNPTLISFHLHHNLLLLLRLCPQDDSFKEFYALHKFDFPCPTLWGLFTVYSSTYLPTCWWLHLFAHLINVIFFCGK